MGEQSLASFLQQIDRCRSPQVTNINSGPNVEFNKSNLTAYVEEDYNRGYAAAKEDNEQLWHDREINLTQQFELKLEEERRLLSETIAQSLQQQMTAQLAETAKGIEHDVAAILRPFLSQAVLEKSMDEFMVILRRLNESAREQEVEVRVPEELAQHMSDFGTIEGGLKIEMVPSTDTELLLICQELKISTKLNEWAKIISADYDV